MPWANLAQVRRQHQRLLDDVDDMFTEGMRIAELSAIQSVNTNPGFKPQTGGVQRATETKVIRNSKGRIMFLRNKHDAARPLESGSRPHIIRAKPGKTLRFNVGGTTLYRRMVSHPGNRAYKFLSRAHQKGGDKLETYLRIRSSQIASRF